MTRRLYVSDVHLEPEDSGRLRALSALLRAASYQVDEIYVLGDLTEMWIGDDDDSDLATELALLFTDLGQRIRVGFVPGNRDFLLGKHFAVRTGLQILNDPQQLADGTLLAHGDSLCIDDQPYQQMRALLRSATWQDDILSRTLAERRAFGRQLRDQSRTANANKPGNIMDVNSGAVSELTRNYHAMLLIHGHTHRPGIHRLPGFAGGLRVVLGAWERCGWWAIQQDDQVRLRCASISWLGQQSGKQGPAALTDHGAFDL